MKPLRTILFFGREYSLSFGFILIALCIWEILVHALDIADFILPPPSSVLIKFYLSRHLLLTHASVTLQEALGGFVLGAGAGTLLAIAMARSRLVEIYGEERGNSVQYAEAFEGCEYGAPLTEENRAELFPFLPE